MLQLRYLHYSAYITQSHLSPIPLAFIPQNNIPSLHTVTPLPLLPIKQSAAELLTMVYLSIEASIIALGTLICY
jgi:hypothetical protein